jgi:AcrR family transcriptional regulator
MEASLKLKSERLSREQTRERIVAKADELFRHFGFGKTTVADIAAELEMSPANIYKFFPSKEAIIEASGERNLNAMKEDVARVVQSSQSALERVENLVITVFRSHQEILKNEKQIYQLMLTATEGNWACVRNFHDFLLWAMTEIVEAGMNTGEFRAGDPGATAKMLLFCLNPALNPLLLRDPNLETDAVKIRTQVSFLGKALQRTAP